MNVPPVSFTTPAALPVSSVPESTQADSSSTSFQDVLAKVVDTANTDQINADQVLQDFSQGKSQDVQSVVLASVQADLSFRFLLELRNKLTESYQDLSRMQF